MNATRFTYDGISSDVYDIMIGSFSGSEDGVQEVGNVEMTVVKAPHINTFLRANATYNQQLQISFSIMKMNCAKWSDYIFTQDEIGFILRWLARKEYHPLIFDQEGFEYIHYNAILKVDQYMYGGDCVGFEVVATCDAPWGYDQTRTQIFDATNGTITDSIHDSSDEIGCIYPDINIEVFGSGDISIYNEATDTLTKIKNCVAGENIRMSKFVLTSDQCEPYDDGSRYDYRGNHPTLFNDFNWVWMPICNQFVSKSVSDIRVNPITVTGNCIVTFSWNEIRKAVV